MKLMEAARFAEACAKFEEALALSRGIGIQYNLALCYERTGRLASAWTHYLEVANATRARGEPDRQRVAEERAAALSRRLIRLVIAPVEPPADLKVSRSGAPVTRGQWNTAIPVDPGRYRIEARARGRLTWRKEIVVSGEGTTIRVEVPPLVMAPAPAPRRTARKPEAPTEVTSGRDEALRIGGIVGVSVGAAGLIAGGVLGGLALAKKNDAFAIQDDGTRHCVEPLACDDEGRAQIEDARSLSYGSTGAFIAGGVLAATGAFMLIALAVEPTESTVRLRPFRGAISF